MVFENNVHAPALFIFISLIIFMFILYLYYLINGERQHKKVLKDQAKKRNGIVSSGFLTGGFSLNFTHNLNEVKVWLLSTRSATFTYFEVELYKNTNQKMRIYKETMLSKAGKKLGMQDIQIGYEGFDKEVMIKGTDENFVIDILTYEIQDKIIKIIRKHKANIVLDDKLLRLTMPKFVKTNESFDEIMDLTLNIADKITENKKLYYKTERSPVT